MRDPFPIGRNEIRFARSIRKEYHPGFKLMGVMAEWFRTQVLAVILSECGFEPQP